MRKILSILFLILFVFIITYPSIFHLSDRLIGDGGDNYQFFGFQYLVQQNIIALKLPFTFTSIFRYPVGFDLGFGYDGAFPVLLGSLFSFFVNNIIAYNLSVLIILFLNLYFSFLLFYYLTKSNFIGLIGAVIYGSSFYVMARTAGHLNLIFVGWMPLFSLGVLKTIKDGFSKKGFFLILLGLVLSFYSSLQYGLLLSLNLIIISLISFFFFKDKLINLLISFNTHAKVVLLYLLSAFFLVLIIIFPFIKALLTSQANRVDLYRSISEFQPQMIDFIAPNSYLPMIITNLTKNLSPALPSIEKVIFIGWMELLLLIIFLLVYKDSRLKKFLIINIILFMALTKGTFHNYLVNYFPFSFIIESGRFFIFLQFFITIAIIELLKMLINNKKAVYLLVLFLCLGLLIVEKLPYNFWLSPTLAGENFVSIVKQTSGNAVLDIPINSLLTTYNILPYLYKKSIVSGSPQWFADNKKTKSFLEIPEIAKLSCSPKIPSSFFQPLDINLFKIDPMLKQKLIKILKENGIKIVVIHKNNVIDKAKFYFPECNSVRMVSSLIFPQLFIVNSSFSKQQKMSIFFPLIQGLGDTINIPEDGVFYIDGLESYPVDWLPLHIFLNKKEVNFSQKWIVKTKKTAVIEPYLKITVKKHDKITFYFDKNNNSDYSLVNIWYRYIPNKKLENISIDGITKIYEDENATIFILE